MEVGWMDSVEVIDWDRVDTETITVTVAGHRGASGGLLGEAGPWSSQSFECRFVQVIGHPVMWVSFSGICFPALEGT